MSFQRLGGNASFHLLRQPVSNCFGTELEASVGVKSFECGYEPLSQAMSCLLRHAGQKRGLYFTAGQINSRNE